MNIRNLAYSVESFDVLRMLLLRCISGSPEESRVARGRRMLSEVEARRAYRKKYLHALSSKLSAVAGFTLFEILVTIVILTVGMVAVIQMFSIGMFADSDVENTTIAISLTQEKMEEIKNAVSYAAIDGYAAARANIGGDFADFDRTVTVSGDPKEVTVTTYWTQKGQDNSISLVTLFTDYDY